MDLHVTPKLAESSYDLLERLHNLSEVGLQGWKYILLDQVHGIHLKDNWVALRKLDMAKCKRPVLKVC